MNSAKTRDMLKDPISANANPTAIIERSNEIINSLEWY